MKPGETLVTCSKCGVMIAVSSEAELIEEGWEYEEYEPTLCDKCKEQPNPPKVAF